jgi:DNA-binding MarR family transcriptional regulator
MNHATSLQQALDNWSALYMQQSMAGFMHFMRQNALSYSQISVLARLQQHGPTDIISISRELQISKAGAGQLIHRMSQAGWVELRSSTTDKRTRLISLTEAGKLLVDESNQAREQWMSDIACKLPQDKQNELLQAFLCLIDHFSKTTT